MNTIDLKSETLSALKNPFKKTNVKSVYISGRMGWDGKSFGWSACVEFQNGKTEGRQHFEVKGIDGLPEIVKQMDNFIKSL